MLKCISKHFPGIIQHSVPEGELFLWVELPDHMDSEQLFDKCIINNVACVTGPPFYPNGKQKNDLRLNYSNMTNEKIIEGMKHIGNVLHQEAVSTDVKLQYTVRV